MKDINEKVKKVQELYAMLEEIDRSVKGPADNQGPDEGEKHRRENELLKRENRELTSRLKKVIEPMPSEKQNTLNP